MESHPLENNQEIFVRSTFKPTLHTFALGPIRQRREGVDHPGSFLPVLVHTGLDSFENELTYAACW